MVAGGQNHITDSIFHSITGLSLGLSATWQIISGFTGVSVIVQD